MFGTWSARLLVLLGLVIVVLVPSAIVSDLRHTAALGRVEGAIEQVRDSMTFVIESPEQYHHTKEMSVIQLVKTLCHPEDGELTITTVLGSGYDGSPIPGETREQMRDRHRAEIAAWEAEGYSDC